MELERTGGEAVVDVGAHVTNIVVHAAGETRFVRILPSGGRDITVAIARGMSVEDDVAERLKRGELVRDAEPTPEEAREFAEQHAQAREIAMQRATQFVDEIRSSLEFYTAQTQGARIDRLLVSGGGSKLEGFMDIVAAADPGHGGAGPRLQQRRFAALALRGRTGGGRAGARHRRRPRDPLERLVSQVNLLPPEILAAQRQRRLAGVVALAGDRRDRADRRCSISSR